MIAIVDYKKGNIKSVERAFCRSGANVIVTDDPGVVASSEAIILPGVGAFADAMATLVETGLSDEIKRSVIDGKPFLGICLGLHLMYSEGVEHAGESGSISGLGLIDGRVDILPKVNANGDAFKIPHVGWNTIDPLEGLASFSDCELLNGISPGEFFYFTHSYAAPLGDADVAHTNHSIVFPSIVRVNNAFGVQFHPEKSSDAGARIIENFINFVSEV